MNFGIMAMAYAGPPNLSELLFYNKVFATGTDLAGCFLSLKGYA